MQGKQKMLQIQHASLLFVHIIVNDENKMINDKMINDKNMGGRR